jgi:uncharacterized membrane protein YqjE
MDETPPPDGDGLFDSLRRAADGALATVQNRAELFAVELHEEKCRLVDAMLWGAAVVALGMMALTVVTFTIVVLLPDEARVVALIILSCAYLGGTGFAWRGLNERLKKRTALSGTLAELEKDRECLQRKS